MTSIIFGIGLMCILAVIVMLFFKPYDYGASMSQLRIIGSDKINPDENADSQWRSVRIRPGLIPCNLITSLSGQVFLSRDAPELPLVNCSERDCRCHYVFLDDRRSGIDRRVELGRLGEYLSISASDRRRMPGRRTGDLAAI